MVEPIIAQPLYTVLPCRPKVNENSEKTYDCTVKDCKSFFANRMALNEHVHTHFCKKNETCSRCKSKKAREHVYYCSYCTNIYKNTKSLSFHLRIHFGELPFECTQCRERFRQKNNLIRHVLKHDMVKGSHGQKFEEPNSNLGLNHFSVERNGKREDKNGHEQRDYEYKKKKVKESSRNDMENDNFHDFEHEEENFYIDLNPTFSNERQESFNFSEAAKKDLMNSTTLESENEDNFEFPFNILETSLEIENALDDFSNVQVKQKEEEEELDSSPLSAPFIKKKKRGRPRKRIVLFVAKEDYEQRSFLRYFDLLSDPEYHVMLANPGVSVSSSMKRKRGRPKKIVEENSSGEQENVLENSDCQTNLNATENDPKAGPVKRKRGRPRKNSAKVAISAISKENSGEPRLKRGRGRPRKLTIDSENNEERVPTLSPLEIFDEDVIFSSSSNDELSEKLEKKPDNSPMHNMENEGSDSNEKENSTPYVENILITHPLMNYFSDRDIDFEEVEKPEENVISCMVKEE